MSESPAKINDVYLEQQYQKLTTLINLSCIDMVNEGDLDYIKIEKNYKKYTNK